MGWAPLAAERELRNTPTLSTSRSLIHFTVKRHLPRLDRVRNTFPQNIPKASHHWDLRSNAIHPFREALLCSPPPPLTIALQPAGFFRTGAMMKLSCAFFFSVCCEFSGSSQQVSPVREGTGHQDHHCPPSWAHSESPVNSNYSRYALFQRTQL